MLKHTISFQNAFNGIWLALITQLNLRLHFLLGSLAIALAVFLQVSYFELLVLILTIALVMLTEMINSAIEYACNAITLEKNEHIKYAKDIAAGAVLLSAIFAAIIGLMIFAPKLLAL
jgi:diacylglycerol kinase (ATP)